MSIFPNYKISDHEYDTISLSYPLYGNIPPVEASVNVELPCYPWESEVIDESTGDNPDYKLYIGAGTVNGVVAADWDEPVNIATDTLSFIILDVDLSDGAVNTITYSAADTLPTGEELQPVTKGTTPTSTKIILGTVMNTEVCILHNYNIVLRSRLVYQQPIPNQTAGNEQYEYYYTLDPISASYDSQVTL